MPAGVSPGQEAEVRVGDHGLAERSLLRDPLRPPLHPGPAGTPETRALILAPPHPSHGSPASHLLSGASPDATSMRRSEMTAAKFSANCEAPASQSSPAHGQTRKGPPWKTLENTASEQSPVPLDLGARLLGGLAGAHPEPVTQGPLLPHRALPQTKSRSSCVTTSGPISPPPLEEALGPGEAAGCVRISQDAAQTPDGTGQQHPPRPPGRGTEHPSPKGPPAPARSIPLRRNSGPRALLLSGPVPYRLDSSARVAPGGCPRADKGENAAGKGTKERNEAGGPPGLLGTAGEGVSPHLALRGTQYERPNWGGKEGWEVSTLGGSRDLLMSCLQEGTPGTSKMRDPKSTTRIPARW